MSCEVKKMRNAWQLQNIDVVTNEEVKAELKVHGMKFSGIYR